MESLNSNSQERELHKLQQMQDNAKESCMTSFQLLHSFLQVLSYDESKSKRVSKRAFMTLFGQDNKTFTSTMFLYVDQLQNQLGKDEFQEDKSMAAFWVLNNQFQKFIDWQYFLDYDSEMTEKLFAEYTGIKYDRRMKERQMQSRESKVVSSKALDASLVVTECSGTKSDEHITSSSSGTYITHVVDEDIRPINNQVPSAEVHLIAQHNVLANEQQHTDQSELSYDTYLLEKVDINTTPDSTNISHRGGDIDQDVKQDQVKSPLLKAYIKNELRKLKGNSVDTKFAKPSILGKPVLQPLRNQSVVRQPNAFKSERPNFSKPRFASQVDVNNVLSKPVTPHYLPKVREYVLAKPHHVIAPGSSRNSQEESYGSNDMAHNHYLEEARKKTQERNRNSKPSVMHTTSLQNTTNGSKPNPRSNNQISRSLPVSKSSCGMSNGVSLVDHSKNSSSFSDSKHFFCSTCHKCVFNANHDACITKLLNKVNSRKIAIGQRFSPKKSSAMHEKPNTLRSCLRWKPTGRIFKIAGLRLIPTGKMFTDNTTKFNSEPPNGSNDDITNPYECDQTFNVSACTTNLSAVQASLFNDKMAFVHISSSLALQRKMASVDNTSDPVPQRKERSPAHISLGLGHHLMTPGTISSELVPQPPFPTPNVPPIKNDWDSLFCPMFDE
ncbi:hypothetical protein Tco_0012672 [Tanacetum coccineum]